MIISGKPFNPGELRTPITLLQPTIPDGDGGFNVPTYASAESVMAKWINAHGPEVWAANAVQAVGAATVTIRYHADLDPAWRIRKNSLDYEIVSLDNIQERNEYIEMKIKRVVSG